MDIEKPTTSNESDEIVNLVSNDTKKRKESVVSSTDGEKNLGLHNYWLGSAYDIYVEEALEQVKKWDEASAKAFLLGFLDEFPEIFGLEIDEHFRKREDFARRIRESAASWSKDWDYWTEQSLYLNQRVYRTKREENVENKDFGRRSFNWIVTVGHHRQDLPQ